MTRKQWSDDTPEALAASLERAGVDPAIQAALDRFTHGDGPAPQRRKQVPTIVGTKAKVPPGIAAPPRQGPREDALERAKHTMLSNELQRELRRAHRKLERLLTIDPGHPDIPKYKREVADAQRRLADLGLL